MILDQLDQEYTLGRFGDTGNLFNVPCGAERIGKIMSWETVNKAAAGPFVSFAKAGEKDTKTMYICGDPMVIKGRPIGGQDLTEDIGVLPVLLENKFKVLSLRSARLRAALQEKWEVYINKMVDITREGSGFDTTYKVKLSKSKKKPDAKLISTSDKAFAEFIRENKKRATVVPD